MPSVIRHKRVEFTELFYDLVFVYAISKTTSLIHHLHHGIITVEAFSAFLVTVLVLVNTWMIQTVYTNRYGRNSMFNISIMFINMALILFSASMIISENWQRYFNIFCWITGTLSLTLFLEYLAQFFHKSSTANDKKLIKSFLIITGVRVSLIYIAAFLPIRIGYPIFLLGIITTILLPIIFGQNMNLVSINLPHLIERVSLFTIITFGEMIMGIAGFFTPETFTWRSVFYFLIITTLFMYYFGQFDHALDEGAHTQGLRLIYSHYAIFTGLIMTTVSFSFLSDSHAHNVFTVIFLYAGLALFQGGVLVNSTHNKDYLRYPHSYYLLQIALLIGCFIASLLFAQNSAGVTLITTAFLLAIETHFLIFYSRKSKTHHAARFEWF